MATPIIVDGNALVVRSLWGGLKDEIRYGLPFTSGIYGSLNTLGVIVEHHLVEAGQIVAFFDHLPPPRRLRLLPDYKRGRRDHWPRAYREKVGAEPEDDSDAGDLGVFESVEQRVAAMAQIGQVYELLPLLGVTTLCYREREADDGVAAAARVFVRRGVQPVIVTGDHDLWQSIAWGARVWDLGKSRVVEAGNFHEAAGCAPDAYTLFRALTGDASDRIRGADGFGHKRAAALLERAHWHVRLMREPRQQLRELCRFLRDQEELSRAEIQLVADRKRLDRVIRAIDLRASFGPTPGLERRLAARLPVDSPGFVRTCRALGLEGSGRRLVRPFETAQKRRDRKKSKRRPPV